MVTLPQKTLLSIDDDENILLVIQASLQLTPGWVVLTANSGQQGLETAQNNCLDAILLDGQMPDIDGIATLQRLRAHPKTQHIPVIFLTATPNMIEPLQTAELGVRAILTKPFEPIALSHQVALALDWL